MTPWLGPSLPVFFEVSAFFLAIILLSAIVIPPFRPGTTIIPCKSFSDKRSLPVPQDKRA